MVLKVLGGAFVVFSLFVLLRLALLSVSSRTVPELGLQDGRLSPCPRKPNCVSTAAKGRAHRIAPLSTSADQDAAMAQAVEAITSMGGCIVASDSNYLRAEFSTRLFRFVDDLELLWNPVEGHFDLRSASRVGNSDLGANRRRVERLRGLLVRATPPVSGTEDN
jgi:uncharacterized protein (DUF1499 family)